MTHGEELGSETHQDSAVLTYLEGLLMHQVAGGPGATGARRSEAGGGGQEQADKPLPSHGAVDQGHDRRPPLGGSTQHPKKARLLRSETWSEPEVGGQRSSGPVLDLNVNGRGGEHHRGGVLDGSPKCKGESTLLASLLQSFSSRLQTVALSQQIMQSLKQQDPARLDQVATAQAPEGPRPCLGTASSRLKGLMKKSKIQNHNSLPCRRQASQERPAESPQGSAKATNATATNSTASAASESLSCTARLKAVASLVNTRSSPAPSPRPSVACSQLALLLSSEAHLQQYSREQALKAQLSSRSASERLAAMATQQTQEGSKPGQVAADTFTSLNGKNTTLSPPALGSSRPSPSPLAPVQSRGGGASSPQRTPQPFKERRPFDRHGARPPQNCSSLLLQLLNNHNAQKGVNGHGHPQDERSACPSRSSPLESDSEYSNPETSLPRDSSDAESSCSSCSPIDLSIRSRVAAPLPGSSCSSSSSSSSSTLDKLTETLINRWRPENTQQPVAEVKEPGTSPPVKPHHKVTLLQLLLDHKNSKGNRSTDNQQGVATKPSGMSMVTGRLTPVSRCEETRTRSPRSGLSSRSFQSPPMFSHGQDSNGSVSPYNLYSPPPAQSLPLNLCKSKPPTNPDTSAPEPAFSASKLLQNLAQCGLQSSTSSSPVKTPLPPTKLRVDPPVTLLERLNAPILRNGTPILDPPHAPILRNGTALSDTPPTTNPALEIESLLERRTVLQLLLGATSNKDKLPTMAGVKRKRSAPGGVASEQRHSESDSCYGNAGKDEAPLEVKIKTEPRDEGLVTPDSKDKAEQFLSTVGRESERLRPLSAPHEEVKREPVSPGAVARDGLLSQLLKQQCRNLPVNAPSGMLSAAIVKEEAEDHQVPSVPKKRRFCAEGSPGDWPGSELRVNSAGGNGSSQRDGSTNDGCRSISGSPQGLIPRKAPSLTEADSPSRGLPGEAPPADARGGFNVLKQLLLSDNCLKDLSQLQTRGAPSPTSLPPECKVNGNTLQRPSHLQELVNTRRDPSPQGSPSWGVLSPRQDSPKLNLVPVKREPEGPMHWEMGAEERHDQHPDSPRLTKANPILYYMLQKGSSQLGREKRGQGPGLCTGGAQVRVKEEPETYMEDDNHRLNSKHHLLQPDETAGGTVQRLNGSLKKC